MESRYPPGDLAIWIFILAELSVFAVFSVLYLKEPLGWNHLVGFAFIGAGAFFIFHKWA